MNMNALIPREIDGAVISQRMDDGYVNATAMCKAAGKRWNNYWQNDTSQSFAGELAIVTGIPVTEVIQSVRGGLPEFQGTWVHPQMAIHLAQWLSPRFAVQVSQWVYDWMTQGRPAERASLGPSCRIISGATSRITTTCHTGISRSCLR